MERRYFRLTDYFLGMPKKQIAELFFFCLDQRYLTLG
jgi:hypothetical protein